MKRVFMLCLGSAFQALLIVTFFVSQAHAIPLAIDDLLVDRAGLKWLSPVYSAGVSYNQINSGLNIFPEFRFASVDEVTSLALSYGIGENSFHVPQHLIEDVFVDFIPGYTLGDPTGLTGWVGDSFDSDVENGVDIGWFEEMNFSMNGPDPGAGVFYQDVWPMALANNHRSSDGWWIVHEAPAPVPEPATMLLFGTGLVGLIGARYRKKK